MHEYEVTVIDTDIIATNTYLQSSKQMPSCKRGSTATSSLKIDYRSWGMNVQGILKNFECIQSAEYVSESKSPAFKENQSML